MTLDEAIKQAEEVAEENQRIVDTGIVFDDVTIDMLYCDDTEVIAEHLANYQRCADRHKQLAEWLKELKQLREQTRWIPVSEQLPKKSGNYWCTFGGSNIKGIDYYTTESDAKEIFDNPEDYDSEDYEYAGWRSQNVIAWMPLPKPYEPQESEDNEDIPMEYFESGGC